MLIICYPIILIPDTTLSTQNDLNFPLNNHRRKKTKFVNIKCVPKYCALDQELDLFACCGKYILIFQMEALEFVSLMIIKFQIILLSPFTQILFSPNKFLFAD